MTEPGAVDLIHLEDTDGDRCIVRVTGRYKHDVLASRNVLQAEVLAHTSFADARLELYLSQRDLDAWQQELTGLTPGTGASIGGDRGLNLVFHLQDDHSLAVTLHDPDRLSTVLWIRPQENWIKQHHERLEQVRQTWPETAPVSYEWRPPQES
ncbi:DUF5959 family protein [Streptomyces sp. NPDC019990]|uniref:DUF5959 family protein n=1 Tax=Streptomyces sp. NPDC019990 TaxID=3154693 RepID=UPI0033DCC636